MSDRDHDTDTVALDKAAYVRPEDAKDIGGVQSSEDRVHSLLSQLEAAETIDDDVFGNWRYYIILVLVGLVGIIGSGPIKGGGGGGTPTPVGMADLTPMVEVVAYAV